MRIILKKNITKKFKKGGVLLFVIALYSCVTYKNIHRNEIQGFVFSKNNTPVHNATVLFVLEKGSTDMKLYKTGDSVLTDKNGFYQFSEVSSSQTGKIGGDKIMNPMLPYRFIIKKNGIQITDTINTRSYKVIKNKITIDTLYAQN